MGNGILIEDRICTSTMENISIKIIENTKELNGNFNSLDKISVDPVTDLDYIKYQIANSSTPKKLLLASVNNGETPSGHIVGFIQPRPLCIKLGFKTIFKLKANCLVISNTGILGCIPKQFMPNIFIKLRKFLKKKGVDYIYFTSLRINSEFYKASSRAISFIYRDFIIDSKIRWGINLPGSFEEYLSKLSKKHRAHYHNAKNRIKKRFKDDYSIKCYSQESEIDNSVKDLEFIASKTWQRKLNIGFRYTPELHNNWIYYAKRNWLRVYVLYINQKPVAYWCGLLYKRKFYPWIPGFNPEYEYYHPGMFLLVRMIAKFCAHNEVDFIDLGLIDMQYKREFGTIKWEEAPRYIFVNTLTGFFLFIFYNFTSGLNGAAKHILSHLKLLDKVKNNWLKKNSLVSSKFIKSKYHSMVW
jgi:hypothetical protein